MVTATVVDLRHSRRGNDTITVNFVTRDGRPVTAETSNYDSAEVGRPIEIRYDPQKPSRIQGASYPLDLSFTVLLYGGFAFLLVLFTVLDLCFNLINRLRGTAVE